MHTCILSVFYCKHICFCHSQFGSFVQFSHWFIYFSSNLFLFLQSFVYIITDNLAGTRVRTYTFKCALHVSVCEYVSIALFKSFNLFSYDSFACVTDICWHHVNKITALNNNHKYSNEYTHTNNIRVSK